MPKSEKPEVPRNPHRSTGDTGVPQRGHQMPDDPRQASESGEPDEADRSRGRIIDESGEAAGKQDAKETTERKTGEHWESGRHKAQ